MGTDEIDAVAKDLREVFPSAEELHADPEGVTERWKGHPVEPKEVFVWPEEGPGFRPDQQRWSAHVSFPGRGAQPALRPPVDRRLRRRRALGSTDIRLYQAGAVRSTPG